MRFVDGEDKLRFLAGQHDATHFWTCSEWVASFFFRVRHYQWLLLFVGTALTLRLLLSLNHPNFLGIDGGAYILSALDVQGKDATSVGFPRPPLAPGWLLVPFLELGYDLGYKIWTVLFSLLPIIPVYLLTRDLVNRSAAIFAVAFFTVDMMQMEMMVTGSLPLIGFTCIGMALWSLFRLSRGPTRLHLVILASSVALLPYINQTAAAIGAIVLVAATISLFLFARREEPGALIGPQQGNILRYVLPAAATGMLIGLGALPWYLTNAPGNSELRFPGPILTMVHWTDPALLLQFPIVAALIYFLRKESTDCRMKTVALLLGLLGTMMLFLSWDEAIINILFRSRYLLGILVYPAIAHLLCRTFPLLPSLRQEWATVVPMVAVWAVLLWGQVFIFNAQTNFKDMVLPETVDALSVAQAGHPDKAIITNAYSLSHWVAAMNQVEAPNTWSLEPSPFYSEEDRHVRCLLGWIEGCDPRASANALGARYLLIDDRMPEDIMAAPVYGAPTPDPWANLTQVPWLTPRYQHGSVTLWEIVL